MSDYMPSDYLDKIRDFDEALTALRAWQEFVDEIDNPLPNMDARYKAKLKAVGLTNAVMERER